MAKPKGPQDLSALMQEIGSPNGFDPIPRGQHQWPQEQGVKGFVRFWSFLIQTTVAFSPGRERSPYMVDESGRELHIEDVAELLGIDAGYTRRLWREAKARGLARNGTKAEGKRRLYICGDVQPVADLEDELDRIENGDDAGSESAEDESGDTDSADPTDEVLSELRKKGLRRPFSPYLLHQIARLPQKQRQAVITRLAVTEAKDRRLQADLDEVRRTIIEREQDSIFAQFRIKKIRVEHKFRDPEQQAEIHARNQRILALMPEVERYAQSAFDFGEPEAAGETEPAQHSRTVKPATAPRPRATPPPPDPVVPDERASWIAELTARGVTEKKARELLKRLKPDQPVSEQLRHADYLIAEDRRGRGKITNPPGYYIWVLEQNMPVPEEFKSPQVQKAAAAGTALNYGLSFEEWCQERGIAMPGDADDRDRLMEQWLQDPGSAS